MLTALRRRRVETARRPSTTWPSQAAPLNETDDELRDRLGLAPLATAIAPVVAVPATSNDLEVMIASVRESLGKTVILFILFDRLYNKFLGGVPRLAWLGLWDLAWCVARAVPVRKALLQVLLYAFGTYLFEPGYIGANFLSCLAQHTALSIESRLPRREVRRATLVEEVVSTSAVVAVSLI